MVKQETKTAGLTGSVPADATFNLVLSKLIEGQAPVIPNANCEFHYHWDFATNMGSAQLIAINGAPVNIQLFPLGIEGQLDFMSDMAPTPFIIDGKAVIIYRVILDINLSNNERSAEIMFNTDGSVIQGTPNIPNQLAASGNLVPPEATFNLVLSKLLEGQSPVLPNANCQFHYKWDFAKNMGLAELISINGTPVNIQLYALGISGMLGFMSDMPPTTYNIGGTSVVIRQVVLDINLSNNARSAGIMFNADGSVIQATPNFLTRHLAALSLPVPPEAIFNLVLSKLYKGTTPVIPNAVCEFHYKWDFKTNMGLAQLIAINGSPVNITLHPTGLSGMLAFMSDIPPTKYTINGKTVIIDRVILNIMLNNGERKAGIMFNEDGSVIQVTPNFINAQAANLS